MFATNTTKMSTMKKVIIILACQLWLGASAQNVGIGSLDPQKN
jgi:hypothetical protein